MFFILNVGTWTKDEGQGSKKTCFLVGNPLHFHKKYARPIKIIVASTEAKYSSFILLELKEINTTKRMLASTKSML